MLEDLELLNVGPAARMKAEFAPRVNLITGDNGLGKSFLLDCDPRTERGSIEAEQAVLRARELVKKPSAPLDEVIDAHADLRRVLPDVDRFWVRWNAFVEERGGTP